MTAADYTNLISVKTEIGKSILVGDAAISLMITAASRAIDRWCNREPGKFVADTVASARVYTGSGGTVQWIHECIAITQLAVKTSVTETTYVPWAVTDYLAATGDPLYPDYNRQPYHFLIVNPAGSQLTYFISGRFSALRGFRPDYHSVGRGAPTVQVTAKWGYSAAVPPEIEQACIIQVARWYRRGQSSFADAIANDQFGQLMFTKPLDPDVKSLLMDGRYVVPATGGLPH